MKKISKTEFTNDVNNGMPKGQLITKYGISSDNVKKIARQLGLTIKRATKPKFVLVDDVAEATTTNALN